MIVKTSKKSTSQPFVTLSLDLIYVLPSTSWNTPATQYTELNNNIAYLVPQNPGIAPTFNPDAAQFQINEAIRLHGLSANEYHTFRNVAQPSEHDSKKHRRKVHLLDLMEHIWSTYGNITTLDLTVNEKRMYAYWNPSTPIETLYEQLVDGQQFAT